MEALKTICGSDSDDDAGDGEPPMSSAEFKEETMICMFTFQMTKKMQIPLLYAEAIIVEIKGTSQEVQIAEMLIQEFISGYREPEAGSCRNHDAGQRSYSQMPTSGYYPSQSYGRYESSDITGPY
ncbi:hypothetical protein J5N97_001100 [Dioscorea zingiberensis]|uniref:Uncharacterized protein n=1 Tax=Dioscorea zingiberensis TaxID=325984 RepID=A0A9D5BVR5_9LILI|nr:hypothetical protein J5N97_001100 [Dioscorea zingiberensis]